MWIILAASSADLCIGSNKDPELEQGYPINVDNQWSTSQLVRMAETARWLGSREPDLKKVRQIPITIANRRRYTNRTLSMLQFIPNNRTQKFKQFNSI